MKFAHRTSTSTLVALLQVIGFVLAAPSSSIVDKFIRVKDPTIHSYEESSDDPFGTYLPHSIEAPESTIKGSEVTSNSRPKTTRQIFDLDDDDEVGSTRTAGYDGTDPEAGREADRPGRNGGDESDETPSSKEKAPSSSKTSKEEFNGFPDDFMRGMKPFNFEDTSGSHRNSKSTGFVRFNMDDHNVPSLASSLGGLTPFPPNRAFSSITGSSSEDEGSSSSTSKVRPKITPESFLTNEERQASHEGGNDGDDDDDHFKGFDSKPSVTKFVKIDPNARHNREERSIGAEESAEETVEPQEFQSQRIESSERPPSSSSSTDQVSSNQRRSDGDTTTSSSNVVRTVKKGSVLDRSKIDEDFRDSGQVQLGESQHLMPHFINGPLHRVPMFGGGGNNFRPLETASHQGPPPVRHFRQASRRPPFFGGPVHFYGSGDEGFFPGGGEFGPGPALVPTSHFDSLPQRFSQPEFRFPGERVRKLPRHRPPSIVQQQHNNNHGGGGDSNDNHHGASATNNILGSGNFGIIRGGLFADDDNPEPSITPLHGYLASNDDFFHGFRDFQPFGGGPMHNALSSKSHNIHRSQSKTASVIVRPSSTSTSTTPSSRSKNATTEMEEQIMEEK